MCPFVDQDDERCSDHLTLRNLASAFEHCADRYMTCPVFQELLVDDHVDAPCQPVLFAVS